MRVTILLLLICAAQAFAVDGHSQDTRFRLNMTNETVKNVLNAIENQTDFYFIYEARIVDVDRRVSVSVENKNIKQVLDNLFTGTDVVYTISDRRIALTRVSSSTTIQQQRTVSGKVIDSDGELLPGVSIVVQGTLRGTITDADGMFSIRAEPGEVLIFSYIGYNTRNINITEDAFYDIIMTADLFQLDAVVVTALGIKRSQKTLSYNVQEINQEELVRVKDANFINSISGKVAGVMINSSSSGVGGAGKVTMRGVKSIDQSSNTLYVIDGIPMFNLKGEGDSEHGSKGTTEAIADINPEDIESISVLTGASAAALYGSRGANGAIVITTKKGAADGLRVTLSSNNEITGILMLPKFQNRYGTGDLTVESGSLSKSWGNLLHPDSRRGYSPKSDFFRYGTIFMNSLSVSTGNEKNQTYFSAASVNSEGIIPNNEYERYNFTFRNTAKFLNDKMTLDIGGSYIIQKDQNMINQGQYSNPIVSAYLFPRGDDWEAIKMFERYDAARKISIQYWPQGEGDYRMQNPYWIAYRNLKNNDRQRYMFNASLQYEILDWLDIMGRVRIDNDDNDYTEKLYASTNTTLAGEKGSYGITKSKEKQSYADVLVNISKTFDNFSFIGNLGASISDMKNDDLAVSGPIRLDGIPNVFNVFNLDDSQKRNSQTGWREQTQSVYGSVELGFKSMYYLTVTGRNDWASQLAGSSATSFFYPSVGLSAILSEIFTLPEQINFLKLRGSFSSVGTPYPRNLTTLTYSWDETNKIWETKSHYPIGDLKPERTDSWEVGLAARLFKNISLDFSWYRAATYNQTFDPQISVSSGYSTIYLQTGNVHNTGVEASLTYTNKWKDWRWNSVITFGLNENKIIELVDNYPHPETGEIINKDRLDVGGLDRARFILKKGGGLGDLYSIRDLTRDSNGNIYVDANGEIQTYNSDDIKLGSVFPKSNVAWRNDFSWKNFDASFMLSARMGGIVYSGTQAAMDLYGVSEATALARDNGGVVINGTDVISAQEWYTKISTSGGVPQYYVYSATNVRLQEVSIGYTIPKTRLRNVLSITVSLTGRNLWMIYNKAPFDPESVATTGNYYQGIDYFMVPNTRNMGLNLRVQF